MVDYTSPLSLLSALVIVGCFALLAGFIVRIGAMEREAVFNLSPPRIEIPSHPMIQVKNPFHLRLRSCKLTTSGRGVIDFALSTVAPCQVTLYWEVRKDTIDSLCKSGDTRSTFDDSENSSDSDLEEAPSMSTVPLEQILLGSYRERSLSELYDCGSDYEFFAESPSNMEDGLLESSSFPSNLYTLIVAIEVTDTLEQQQPSDIVALLTAVQVSKSVHGNLTCNIVKQCIETAEGNILSMKKLFVVESDDLTDAQSLPAHSQVSSDVTELSPSSVEDNVCLLPSELANAVCIVCRTLPVTRAFLPCRHACVCGLCFQQLSYCPMCRGIIQSYFKVRDEPFVDNAESDVSSELRNMTVGEILRGVFSAS